MVTYVTYLKFSTVQKVFISMYVIATKNTIISTYITVIYISSKEGIFNNDVWS